jgi:predicted TIM-barrel fold metal-dependent hydrolase
VSGVADKIDTNKRRTLTGLMAVGAISTLQASEAADSRYAFLAPLRVNPFDAPLKACIDVHAHFFNASDVTVEGYLEGPVAHSFGKLGWLVRLLAPIADGLGSIAISARDELRRLPAIEQELRKVEDKDVRSTLRGFRTEERRRISKEFNDLTRTARGRKFREGYERVMRESTPAAGAFARPRIREIDRDSMADAMNSGEESPSEEILSAYEATDRGFYAEGLLAFIGYMLSSRWTNLTSYQEAMTSNAHTIGVDRVLGALVNFDRWLDGRVRSPHEDQLELHAELSRRSQGYLQPIMSYNPWTDIAEQDRGLALIERAKNSKFVGVKIYPANGFRAWGNAAYPDVPGRPTGAQLDHALQKFWLKCLELDLPVMSHAAPRMGKDDAHDLMGSPKDWKSLLEANFWPKSSAMPRLNLGHFGGDLDHPRSSQGLNWPAGYAALMSAPRANHVFADLGYELCARNSSKCMAVRERLKEALAHPIGDGQLSVDRVMFGSDWLMLSREKDWSSYPRKLLRAIQAIARGDVDKLFALNARKCFTRVT